MKLTKHSWQDGRVLSALVDSIKDGLLTTHDLGSLTGKGTGFSPVFCPTHEGQRPGDALRDLDRAMQVAQEEFSISRLIDPEDLVTCECHSVFLLENLIVGPSRSVVPTSFVS